MRFAFQCALLLSLSSCNSGGIAIPSGIAGQPLRTLTAVSDVNPDPRIVEFDLVALESQVELQDGTRTTVWTYNGMLPGPLIEANAGDQVVVRFLNLLPEPTTIHWHGVRLIHAMDGSHASQHPVATGKTFEYRFTLPDPGLYWYHPHVNGSRQVARGLYGAIVVHGGSASAGSDGGQAQGHVPPERVLVLSDIMLDSDSQVMDPSAAHQMTPLQHALGHEGNVLLVNGQIEPRIGMRPGSHERWRIVNCCTSRYINLAIPGQQFTVLGLDSDLAQQPALMDALLLAPGERADILVSAPEESGAATLTALPYSRIHGFEYDPGPPRTLSQISYSGKLAGNPAPVFMHTALPTAPAIAAERGLQFAAKMDPALDAVLPREAHMVGHGDAGDGTAEFIINMRSFPNVPVIEAQLDTWEQWTINNHSEMDHPFHLHGFRFLVLDVNGVEPPLRCWKDTVNLPGSAGGDVTVRLLVSFDGHPGLWPYHCHILHHQELGMMAEVNVTP
ncbi:MAG: multicopper oxidase family protein [bacterium]|nr:multicopper oxidase family protein [bacterium]